MRVLTRGRRARTAAALATAALVLTGAAGLVAGSDAPALAAGGAVVLDEGEIDLTPRLVDGKLQLQIDDRTGANKTVREPSDVVLHAPPATKTSDGGGYPASLIGIPVAYSWQFNGWNAENLFALEPGWNGSEAGGDTTVELAAFEGPGDFGVYTYTQEMSDQDLEAVVHLNSSDAAKPSYKLGQDEEHATPTWNFTHEGVYRITLKADTTLADGTVSSDTQTLAVVVGDTDPDAVYPGDGSTPTATASATPSATPSDSASPTSTAPAAHVIDDGHLDLAARRTDDGLRFQIKEGTAYEYEWYEPDEVVLHVMPAAKRRLTGETTFLGKEGDAVWWLPISQVSGILWPGWSTEEWDRADIDGDVSYQLDSVQGAGNVAVFDTDSLGAWRTWFNSGDGVPDTYAHNVHAHSHSNWAFTAEGVYRTTFTVSATLTDGSKVSDTATIAWVVGDDVDPSTVNPGADDEPTATPTATASDSPSATVSAPAAPSGSASASATDSATGGGSNSSGTSGSSSTTGSVGSSTTGGLASTGTGAAVIAGIAVVALLVGGGAVFAVRRRRSAQ
ncbi:choice-of-anchor M domain-containing protein [Streptomyces umbrinus]|uniref:choice-of-anchor M domain-containing protein n=1 Tax=Streptomyces umbrinus TaxID=67370 RepID=UPI003C30B234